MCAAAITWNSLRVSLSCFLNHLKTFPYSWY